MTMSKQQMGELDVLLSRAISTNDRARSLLSDVSRPEGGSVKAAYESAMVAASLSIADSLSVIASALLESEFDRSTSQARRARRVE